MISSRQLLILTLAAVGSSAFTSPNLLTNTRGSALFVDPEASDFKASSELEERAKNFPEPGRNPDRPELPEVKGDFDWDEKFGGDDDWITENVPGKIVLNDIQLAEQAAALDKLEEKWRKERQQQEYDDARLLGWTTTAETYNGRYAMFFLVVGLLTEYWTGITLPGQVEEMLRVGGVIGFDG
mmetsp:Transcript_3435/g.5029  ORF Transcript_3435/g.5029 Transcript_3435/m.5029 type:complete len:183 (-) Transcript_3435:186-734(-)